MFVRVVINLSGVSVAVGDLGDDLFDCFTGFLRVLAELELLADLLSAHFMFAKTFSLDFIAFFGQTDPSSSFLGLGDAFA